MTSDGRTLKQLSDEATPSPWINSVTGSNGIHTQRGYCIALTHMDEKARRHADAAFVAALVNAYREGRLVEAPERELCTACALPCDRYGCDCVDLAACNAAKLISQSSSVSSLPTREDETE